MRRLLHATVTALLGALILVIGPAAPAWACDCAMLSAEQALTSADLAFTGVVVAIDKPAFPTSSADPVQVRFLVESVRKGSPGDHVTLSTALDGASCGYGFQE